VSSASIRPENNRVGSSACAGFGAAGASRLCAALAPLPLPFLLPFSRDFLPFPFFSKVPVSIGRVLHRLEIHLAIGAVQERELARQAVR
jgi:hypothetical protein